ncbi:Outer membrane efflux protein [Rhodobacteraceae bacterium SB2]|nr:Outer membrane efflux protein [Rhodobacteraceae bacterium SB2]
MNIKTFSMVFSCLLLGPIGCSISTTSNQTAQNLSNIEVSSDQYQTTLVDVYASCPKSKNGFKLLKSKKIAMNNVCYFEPAQGLDTKRKTQNGLKKTTVKIKNPTGQAQRDNNKDIGNKSETSNSSEILSNSEEGFLTSFLNSSYLFEPKIKSESSKMKSKTLFDLDLANNKKISFKNGSISAAKRVMEDSSKVKLSLFAIKSSEKSTELIKAALRPQVTGSLYAGLENVDNPGIGAVGSLNLSKLLYDGGQSKLQQQALKYDVNALFESYRETANEELLSNLSAIVELDSAFQLKTLARTRIDRLEELKQKLSVLKMAGAIDATTIAQSNLLVSKLMLRVEELEQQFEIAQQKFKNKYGIELTSSPMDKSLRNFCEKEFENKNKLLNAPSILREYFYLQKARTELTELKTKSDYTIGVEAGLQQSIDMSSTQLTPSFGVVIRKNLSDGNKLATEITLGEKKIISQEQVIKGQYQLLETKVKEIRIDLRSFKRKLDINNLNVQYTLDEILFLEKQLSIGQSKLTSIVSAEAQLFELETQTVRLRSQNYLSKLMLLASLGKLTDELNIKLVPLY